MIQLKNITKKFDQKTVYESFSLDIKRGEITAVLGASGVGKTTLLNILSGLTPYEGEIVGGAEAVSFVFQEDRLLPFLTVNKNLEYALGKGDYSEGLKSVGLEGEGGKLPGELSGGMARRVALLRAFLKKSDLLLLDEPFGSLDLGVKYKLMDLFMQMWKSDGRTTLIVTHNLDEALYLGQRIIVLGEGGSILLDERGGESESLRKKIEGLFIEGR